MLTEKEKLRKEKMKYRESVRKEKQKRKKQFSRSKLIAECDRVFSLYIRWRDAWKPCCTCGARWEENYQAWHFMSRRHYHTRWTEKNCHAQCPRDNLYGSGEQYSHALFIDKTYGAWTAWMIQKMANSTDKITDHELIETILHYYKKCFDLWIDYKPKKQYCQSK